LLSDGGTTVSALAVFVIGIAQGELRLLLQQLVECLAVLVATPR